tara:strand:- start:306 stop:701 length:396 start_codon:yes stop_codon:yes gene_type:complete
MQFVLKNNYIILLVLLCYNFVYCMSPDTLDLDKSPDVALFLSLLPLLNVAEPNEVLTIPSLGQLYNEKPLKAFILSAMKSYWLIDYDKSKKDSDIKDRNRSLWWLFGLIMYGAIDAYTDANLDKFNKNYKD